MKEFLEENLVKILEAIIVFLLIVILIIIVFDIKIPKKDSKEVNESNDVALVSESNKIDDTKNDEEEEKEDSKFYVDIKGAVKKPGVYEVDKTMIINDVIKLAGGLKSNASTKYLNLSKKVSDEMVINIFTNTEVKKLNITESEECKASSEDISSCATACVVESGASSTENGEQESNNTSSESNKTETNQVSGKVNINVASLEELMTISGIGESKAKAILEYRNTKGKFNSIEDIKNVSGIGDALYAKIKDSITV